MGNSEKFTRVNRNKILMINRHKFFEYFANEVAEDRFTQGKAYRFLYDLNSLGLLFHLDDAPETVVSSLTGGCIFTADEVQILQERIVPKLFSTPMPDFQSDPHTICLNIMNPERERVLPRWGFSFDEEPDNAYIGFTEPKRWNGWGCPWLCYKDFNNLLLEGRYRFEVEHGDGGSVFTIYGNEEGRYDPSDWIAVKARRVLTGKGEAFPVYDTSPLGLCFSIDDCYEANKEDWEGFF